MKCKVILFPGSNCDDDMVHVLGNVFGLDVEKVFHKETSLGNLKKTDLVVVPGGFSYGDYVRCGALAKFSPIMEAIRKHAKSGGYVLGICNGFQILCEAGLLPGVLLRNTNRKYICKNVWIKPENTNTPLTKGLDKKLALKIPIAHAEGNYYADAETLAGLEKNKQIIFRYCTEGGKITTEANPNGAVNNIAGICNEKRNVFGMMPHPERAAEALLGNQDGYKILACLVQSSARAV
jgi:phosphoribosylformylglycinamidine synthase subunit PurQ / glutaminase